jgi:hypothetical protein
MALLWGVATFSTAAAACSLSDLDWMVGNWKRPVSRGYIYERWVMASPTDLIGFSWAPSQFIPGVVVRVAAISAEGDKLVLRQRHFDGALAHGAEDVEEPVAFAATSCGPASITFKGLGKWAGGSVIYRRAGATLTVEGEIRDNGAGGHYAGVLTKE